jgi:membrane-bound lytic murein transglycosylase D
VSSGSNNLSKELKNMEKEIPLPYHNDLTEILRSRASTPVSSTFLEYEPFLDSVLTERKMPLELKYLPLSLSGMRTNYRKGDRCGCWAMPSLVGMRYGLTINDSIDERTEMAASTEAALKYLSDLHQKYEDWWYAILAYSNSPNSLNQALAHNGGKTSLWDFYEQGLMPDAQVIADFISYVYLANEDSLTFAEVKESTAEPEKVEPEPTPVADDLSDGKHLIKKGDNLTRIAAKYHVTISELMEWNNLNDDKILEGQILIIKK